MLFPVHQRRARSRNQIFQKKPLGILNIFWRKGGTLGDPGSTTVYLNKSQYLIYFHYKSTGKYNVYTNSL